MPRLRERLHQRMLEENWLISFSISVVTCTAPPSDTMHIMYLAYRLMDTANRGGKDRVEYASYPAGSANQAYGESAGEHLSELR